jgi:hypothetical protein
MLEVASGDRIDPDTLRSSKRLTMTGNEDSQPRCICIVQIRQCDRPIAERDVLCKVGNHMRTIREPERKRIDEFEGFIWQAQKLWVLDRADIAHVDFLTETCLGWVERTEQWGQTAGMRCCRNYHL